MKSLAITSLLAVVLAASACVPESKPASCANPTELTNEDVNGGVTLPRGCYAVTSSLKVDDGVLTLEPGVRMVYSLDVGMEITGEGRLRTRGTPNEPVEMFGSVQERGHWQGLLFVDSDGTENVLEGLELSHAGGRQWHGGPLSRAGIYVRGDDVRLTVKNSTFIENAMAGILADTASPYISIESSRFERNETPLWLDPNLLGDLRDLEFVDNDDSWIRTAPKPSNSFVHKTQTWTDLGVPYFVEHTIRVEDELFIAPGVTLIYDQDAGMSVSGEGRLTAEGDPDRPIIMTGFEPERGFWKGLHFSESLSGQNTLDHVLIEYAGSGQWHGGGISRGGIYARGDGVALAVSNAMFRQNAQAGLVADGGGADLSIDSSIFTENELPLWMEANLVGRVSADTSVTGNDNDYVRVGTGRGRTEVYFPQTWNTLDAPYRMAETIRVTSDLQLSAGMTLEFTQNTGIHVYEGTLVAEGSASNRIRFIPADGQQLAGYWKGISLQKSFNTTNRFSYVDVMYGGSTGWHGASRSVANIHLWSGGERSYLRLEHTRVVGSGHWGISIEADSVVQPCTGVEVRDNGSGGEGGNLLQHKDATYQC